MKKKFLFLLLGLAAVLAGCGSRAEAAQPPAAVCYAIANTANSKGLNLGSPLVQDTACETIENYGFISVVNIDGSPEVVLAESYDIPEQYKQASREKLKLDARANAAALLTGLQNVIADDPEVDYLGGLQLAVRSLASLEGYGSKTIIVLGTGLSSAGTVDFRNNLLSAQPEAVVEALAERSEIPDFTGITVVWQQLGDTAAPQQPLTQAQRIRLQQLWGGIVERGNGSFVCSDIIPLSAVESVEYPPVSVVELPGEEPIVYEPEAAETESQKLFEAPVILTEEQVTFIGDQARYRDTEAALAVLEPLAGILLQNPEVRVLLVGTTAGDQTNDYTLKLSRDRARTVRDTLVQYGVAEDRIEAIGMGASDPWHISGVGVEGSLAAQNRKVVLLDASTELAGQLLAQS